MTTCHAACTVYVNEREAGKVPMAAASLAHDLRTSVSALRLVAEGMDDGVLGDDDRSAYARVMLTHLRLISHLVGELEHGRVSREVVPAADPPREAIEGLAHLAAAHAVRLVAEISAEGAFVRCEPGQVVRVFLNLLDNAIRHSPPGSTVKVGAARREGGFVEYWVHDEGPGIAATDVDCLFSVPAPAAGVQSRGLGLLIARSIVRAHGGRIWAAPGPGGQLRLVLPCARAAQGASRGGS